jgi:hypothetical protein
LDEKVASNVIFPEELDLLNVFKDQQSIEGEMQATPA